MDIFLVDPAPLKASNDPLLCIWCGRENGYGARLWEESECTGELVFLADGKIIGDSDPCDVRFTASLDAKTTEPTRTVKDIWKKWERYNERLTQKRSSVVGVDATTTRTMQTAREILARMNLA